MLVNTGPVSSGAASPAIADALPTYYLVGDRIKSQLLHPQLLSISELEALIDKLRGNVASMPAPLRLSIGQGAPLERVLAARQRLDAHGLGQWILMPQEHELQSKASAAHTHKLFPRNIIISDPGMLTEVDYAARLLIDEGCAEMSDHLSGKHIQGMVLVEAARQMVLAVGEKYLLSGRGRAGFITHRMDVEFHELVLPFEVDIRLHIDRLRRADSNNFKASATTVFEQVGVGAASVRLEFSALDGRFLQSHEERLVKHRLAVETRI
ncbi:MAG TPA: AfsA-related hotdog domain-containing protein [Steroidobacteraceae bacterium]